MIKKNKVSQKKRCRGRVPSTPHIVNIYSEQRKIFIPFFKKNFYGKEAKSRFLKKEGAARKNYYDNRQLQTPTLRLPYNVYITMENKLSKF
jgi:hypothetical protein